MDRSLARFSWLAALAAVSITGVVAAERAGILLGIAYVIALAIAGLGVYTARRNARDTANMNRRLAEQATLLEAILAGIGDGIVVMDPQHQLALVNPAARDFVPADTKISVTDSGSFIPPQHKLALARALTGEHVDGQQLVLADVRGSQRTFDVTTRPVVIDGRVAGAVGVFHDVTELRRVQRDIAEAKRRWRLLSEASFEGIAIWRDGRVVDVNQTLADWLGCPTANIVGREGVDLFAPEHRGLIAALDPSATWETHLVRHDGSRLAVELRGREVMVHGERLRIAVVRDITERKKREAEIIARAEELRTLSLKDELSGVYNRRGFLELAQHAMRVANRSAKKCSIFYVDLNDMKRINDELGHDAGDDAVRATATLLTEVFRASDVIGRLGGDEFAVFAPECDEDGARYARARLASALERRNARSSSRFDLSLSVGATLFDPEAPRTIHALLEEADAAMYADKRRQKGDDPSISTSRLTAGAVAAAATAQPPRLRLVGG